MKKMEFSHIEHQVTYRFLGGKPEEGILSCGFMRKPTSKKSQINFVIPYYSCFVLLEGSGEYWDDTGFHQKLTPGCVVQRLPNRNHSTRVDGDGKWLEFYISFGKCAFDCLLTLGQLTEKIPVLHITDPSVYLSSFSKLFCRCPLLPIPLCFPACWKPSIWPAHCPRIPSIFLRHRLLWWSRSAFCWKGIGRKSYPFKRLQNSYVSDMKLCVSSSIRR